MFFLVRQRFQRGKQRTARMPRRESLAPFNHLLLFHFFRYNLSSKLRKVVRFLFRSLPSRRCNDRP